MKNEPVSTEARNLLEPFEMMYSLMYRYILELSEEKLIALSAAIKEPNQGNCGWIMYQAALWIRPEVESLIRHRRIATADPSVAS